MGVVNLKRVEDSSLEPDRENYPFVQSQIESIEKYENYLLAIATDEMQSAMLRKFGPSDIVQQTFQQAVTNVTSFRGSNEQQFRSWLRSILINQLRQNVREHSCRKRDHRLERPIAKQDYSDSSHTSEPPDLWPTPSTKAAAIEENQLLQLALARLPDRQQVIIRLRNWEKLSFEEIANRMNLTCDVAKKTWYRALLRLQKFLEP